MSLGTPWYEVEKLIQELAWRDYWQQVWIAKGDAIHTDLKNAQDQVANFQIPEAIVKASTGINALDRAIDQLYNSGYMHNHMRMYIASVCCNVAKSHWYEPSRWLYANLLDGDIASNQLSWQWVAGTFSNKKYYANQENINHFFKSKQKNTFLDIDYSVFSTLKTPEVLVKTIPLKVKTDVADLKPHQNIAKQETLIYNYYNIDPSWHEGENFQRIFLIEPSKFRQHPISAKCMNFALELTKNIPDIKLYVGEFEELHSALSPEKIHFKEHPLNYNYRGHEDSRDWISSVNGYFPSFFSYWKKCKKELVT